MIISCPACESRYETAAGAFGPEGRRVRCASCGHSWMHVPEGSELELVTPAPPAAAEEVLTRVEIERRRRRALEKIAQAAAPHERVRLQRRQRRLRHLRIVSVVIWLMSAAGFVGLLGVSWVFREDLAGVWPQSASVFRMFGQEVNRYGLELRDVRVKRSHEGMDAVISVSGRAVNITDHAQEAVPVRIVLRDGEDKELEEGFAEMEGQEIAPGEGLSFSLKFHAPPPGAVSLRAGFSEAGHHAPGSADKEVSEAH